MPTRRECISCCEVESIVEKKQENVNCIINHEGFQTVCLDVWVLQAAYFNYRQHYGDAEERAIHE